MPSNDFGLGAVVSLRDSFTGPAQGIISILGSLEKKFGISAASITQSTKLIAAGGGLMLAGGALRRAFDGPIQAAIEFEKAFAEVRTIATDSKEGLEALRSELQLQAVQLGQMPIEHVRLAYQAISNGATEAADRTEVMRVSTMGAVAGLANSVDVLNLLTAGIKAYGESWQQSERLSDIAFQTVNLGQTTMGELANEMQKVLAVSGVLKASWEETFGVVATLTGVTGNTAEVTTQLRAIMASIIEPSEQAGKMARKLGIDWSFQAVQAKGLTAVLDDARQKTGGNVLQLSKLIPRVEGLTGALALLGPQWDSYLQKTKQLADSTGSTKRAFDIMSDTFDFQQKRFGALREALSISIGTPLMNALSPFLMTLNTAGEALVKFADANPSLMRLFTIMAYGASVVASLAGALLILRGGLLLIHAVTPLILTTLRGGLLAVSSTILPLLALGTAFVLTAKVLTGGSSSIAGGFSDLWERGQTVWSALGELVETFDGRFGRMSKSTHDKLKKMGLLEFTVNMFALWARVRAFVKGVGTGFMGMLDQMADGIRSFLPEGSTLRRWFDDIALTLSRLGLNKSIEDWHSFGVTVGTAIPWLIGAWVALSNVSTIGRIVEGTMFALSKMWLVAKVMFMDVLPWIYKNAVAMIRVAAPIALAAAAVYYLATRWQTLVEAFKGEGLFGVAKIALADILDLLVGIGIAIDLLGLATGKGMLVDVKGMKELKEYSKTLRTINGKELPSAAEDLMRPFSTAGEPIKDETTQGILNQISTMTDKLGSVPALSGATDAERSDAMRTLKASVPSLQAAPPPVVLQGQGTQALPPEVLAQIVAAAQAAGATGPIVVNVTLDGEKIAQAVAESNRKETLRSGAGY